MSDNTPPTTPPCLAIVRDGRRRICNECYNAEKHPRGARAARWIPADPAWVDCDLCGRPSLDYSE